MAVSKSWLACSNCAASAAARELMRGPPRASGVRHPHAVHRCTAIIATLRGCLRHATELPACCPDVHPIGGGGPWTRVADALLTDGRRGEQQQGPPCPGRCEWFPGGLSRTAAGAVVRTSVPRCQVRRDAG